MSQGPAQSKNLHLPSWIKPFESLDDALQSLAPASHYLLVTSASFRKRGLAGQIQKYLGNKLKHSIETIKPNPTTADTQSLLDELPRDCNAVIAIGGGSVIDVAKVLRKALAIQSFTATDLIAQATGSSTTTVSLTAVPTTAGTGAEVTPFATLWDNHGGKKHSVMGLRPDAVHLVPELTLSLNRENTLYPGLDALSHALESLWNKNRTEESATFANAALTGLLDNLPKVLANPSDIDARSGLQIAATQAGLAISTTKTAIAHALSYPLTLSFGVPHGLACSFTLSAIIKLYGAQALKLDKDLADNVVTLLDDLALAEQVRQRVPADFVAKLSGQPFEPSRMGNFIDVPSQSNLRQILSDAYHGTSL